jgi:hypothetical protein
VLGFSGLTRPGTYRIRVNAAGATAVSPAFAVGSSAGLYHRLVLNAVRYLTSERDGAVVVPSIFDRQPANLTDQHASVYASPRYDSDDNLLGKLRRIGGPAGSRPTTPSAPNWRRSRTRPAPSTCWPWPVASTRWPRRATSARS